jgi:hypothetical protein
LCPTSKTALGLPSYGMYGRRLYPTAVARGICKIKNGWGAQDSVWVQYGASVKFEISEHQYRTKGHEPPFEELADGEQLVESRSEIVAEPVPASLDNGPS